MKLFEINEPEHIKKKYRGVFKRPENLPNEMDHGVGHFSKVKFGNESDRVTKRSLSTMASAVDLYWTYFDLIEERELMRNPHFPKFYKKVDIEDSEGKVMKKVVMERLYDINNISIQERIEMFNRYFDETTPVLKKLINIAQHSQRVDPKLIESFNGIFVGYIKYAITRENGLSIIKDNTLKQAIEELKDMKLTVLNGALWDIKKENIMIRKKGKPTIVFSDPFV